MRLISSRIKPNTLKEKLDAGMAKAARKLLGAVKPEQQPACPQRFELKPHGHIWHFGSSHYGVMIPDLPEPYRYLSFAAVVGYLGLAATDVKTGLSARGKGDTASLVHGTALSTSAEAYATYSIQDDLKFQASPFSVQFGNASTLMQTETGYRLKTEREDLQVDLALTPEPAITWFGYSPAYEHFANLMRYAGTITQHGQSIEVKGLCTLESWHAVATSTFKNRWLTSHVELPAKIFNYQVINLNDEEQLSLVYVAYEEQPLLATVYYRNVYGESIQYDGEIVFEVTRVAAEPLVTPDGNRMYVPETFYWQAYHEGKKVLEVYATVDTPFCFGLGAGYVSSYQWQGTFNDEPLTGRGYMEFIDKR